MASRSKKKQKKSRLKKIGLSLLLLLTITLLLEGFITRYAVKNLLTEKLEKRGLTGDFEISGSIFTGIKLENAIFSGSHRFQSLSFKEISINYSFSKRKIDFAVVDKLRLEIDCGKKVKGPSKGFDIDSLPSFNQWLKKSQKDFSSLTLELTDLEVFITTKDSKQISFVVERLKHLSGSAQITMSNFHAKDSFGNKSTTKESHLVWSDSELSIDKLTLLPRVHLNQFKLTYDNENQVFASGYIHLPHGQVTLSSPSGSVIKLQLTTGNIHPQELYKRFGKAISLKGKISSLEAQVYGLDRPISKIKASMALKGLSMRYLIFPVPSAKIRVEIVDDVILTWLKLVGRNEIEICRQSFKGTASESD